MFSSSPKYTLFERRRSSCTLFLMYANTLNQTFLTNLLAGLVVAWFIPLQERYKLGSDSRGSGREFQLCEGEISNSFRGLVLDRATILVG